MLAKRTLSYQNIAQRKILFQYKPKITPGHLNIIKGDKYSKKIILTTGAVLKLAIGIWESDDDLIDNWCVASVPIWGEPVRDIIKKQLIEYDKIVTIEEHLLSGGFGSFLLESGLNCKINYLDKDVCNEVGTQNYLMNKFGLNKNLEGISVSSSLL